MDDDGQAMPSDVVEFEESMTRIHQSLGMEIPEWLR